MFRFSRTIAAKPARFPVLAAFAMALSLPASALDAKSLSLAINARNADEARVLNTAITLYSIHRDIRAGADVRQVGRNHAARVHQSGGGNQGIIRQRGQGHSANLSQHGGNNGQVILQYGNGAHADVHQTGGQAGILIQFAP
ncbi:MAG: hypothetical protein JJU24_01950 [Natronohydrobacter sp.]|nr:hypothetical protein [Natronohydrobacter sp.]